MYITLKVEKVDTDDEIKLISQFEWDNMYIDMVEQNVDRVFIILRKEKK